MNADYVFNGCGELNFSERLRLAEMLIIDLRERNLQFEFEERWNLDKMAHQKAEIARLVAETDRLNALIEAKKAEAQTVINSSKDYFDTKKKAGEDYFYKRVQEAEDAARKIIEMAKSGERPKGKG